MRRYKRNRRRNEVATILDTLVTKLEFLIEGTPLETLVRLLNNVTIATQELGAATAGATAKIEGASVAATELAAKSEKTAAELKKTGHEAKEAGYGAEFFNEQMKHLKSTAMSFIGAFLGFEVVSKSVESFNEMSQAMAQVQAGLKSTGNAAGFTSDQLEGMAEKLQDTSTYEKADILKNVTAQLLTFKNVSGNTFSRAQQDIIDYGARFNKSGGELQQVSVQLGRALSNPAEALGALTRYGISFTEAQKKSIEAMVKGGDAAGAQSIILGQLEEKYKGSAQAAADAGAGPLIQFGNQLLSLTEIIGSLIVDALDPVVKRLSVFVSFLNEHKKATTDTIAVLVTLALAFLGVKTAITIVKVAGESWTALTKLGTLATKAWTIATTAWTVVTKIAAVATKAWTIATAALDAALAPISISVLLITVAIAGLTLGIILLVKWLMTLGPVFKKIWADIKNDFMLVVKFIEAGIDSIIGKFKEITGSIKNFGGDIKGLADKVKGIFGGSSSDNPPPIGAPSSNSTNSNITTTNSPVTTTVNLTVHANSSDAHHIGKVVTEHLTRHYKNAARSYDSGIAQ